MNSVSKLDTTTDAARPTRPFYWSVRREVWENRSLYIVPLVVAACDKVPLLAPTGSVITLLPETTTVSLNSKINISNAGIRA